MKKQYIYPEIEIVPLKYQGGLLSASDVLNGGEVGAPELPVSTDDLHNEMMKEFDGLPF